MVRAQLFVTFTIDTGSPATIVGYYEALALQIPFKDSQKPDVINIGGGKYRAMEFNNVKIILKTDDDKAVTETVPVKILRPASEKNVPASFSLLLGMDFLKKCGYKLFCDMKNNEAYLEKE